MKSILDPMLTKISQIENKRDMMTLIKVMIKKNLPKHYLRTAINKLSSLT